MYCKTTNVNVLIILTKLANGRKTIILISAKLIILSYVSTIIVENAKFNSRYAKTLNKVVTSNRFIS